MYEKAEPVKKETSLAQRLYENELKDFPLENQYEIIMELRQILSENKHKYLEHQFADLDKKYKYLQSIKDLNF
jgi:hypothetical protein